MTLVLVPNGNGRADVVELDRELTPLEEALEQAALAELERRVARPAAAVQARWSQGVPRELVERLIAKAEAAGVPPRAVCKKVSRRLDELGRSLSVDRIRTIRRKTRASVMCALRPAALTATQSGGANGSRED